jgi:hypothetical protein
LSSNFIDYGKLIDDAMHVIVKQALGYVANGVLPGKHHFFISFLTSHPDVKISKALRERYPEEMTIVLQHQFENLKITDENFSVVLSFDNVKEKIEIPFDSLVAFADPSVKFGLQFSHIEDKEELDPNKIKEKLTSGKNIVADAKKNKTEKKGRKEKSAEISAANNVVDIDAFRKK